MDVNYFAYGSNLWTDQMRARTGSIGPEDQPPRIAQLAGYRLLFQQVEPDGEAYANIAPLADDAAGPGVTGVVYRCDEAAMLKLDDFEHGYERRAVNVVDMAGAELAAVAYIVRPADALNIGRPSDEYLLRITTGARQHGLPESYLAELLAIAAGG